MEKTITNMRDLARCFARAMNLVSPKIANHHEQVAYLSWRVAGEMNYSEEDKLGVIYGALMHDIGAVILPELEEGEEEYSFSRLGQAGMSFIGDIPRMKSIREIFEAAQVPFDERPADFNEMSRAAVSAEIIELADKISGMIDPKGAALNQSEEICDNISDYAGEELHSEVIEAFLTPRPTWAPIGLLSPLAVEVLVCIF